MTLTRIFRMLVGIFGLGSFVRDHLLGNFRLGYLVWKLSFGILRLGTFAWKLSLRNFRMGSFAKTSTVAPAAPHTHMAKTQNDHELLLRLQDCSEPSSELSLGIALLGKLSLGNFHLGYLVRELSLGNLSLGTLAWELLV